MSVSFAATPAGAVISGEYGFQFRAAPTQAKPTLPARAVPLQYHGGSIIPASNIYAIYWDPQGAYRADWMSLIDRYLHDVGADSGKPSNVFSLDGQYTGPNNTRASYATTFRGAYTDYGRYPTSKCTVSEQLPQCLTDTQIRTELAAFVQANHLPRGLNDIYFILTPPGVRVCTAEKDENACSNSTTLGGATKVNETNGFCGYHSFYNQPESAGALVYAVQPWVAGDAGYIENQIPLKTRDTTPEVLACQNGEALIEPNQAQLSSSGNVTPGYDDYETGLADVIINDLSIEQSNMVVDPLLNGWYQNTTSNEQSDVCHRAFGAQEKLPETPEGTHAISLSNEHINGDNYYLQWAFASVGAMGKGVICWEASELQPHFTAPNPVNSGDIVGFDADESGMALDANINEISLEEPFTLPTYKWDFGDGTSPVIGAGAEYASEFHSYVYGGKYKVTLTLTDSSGNSAQTSHEITVNGPPAPGSEGSFTSSSSGTATSAPPSGLLPGGVPLPAVYEYVMSHSLKKALRYGLALRYKVNEQVAGVAEVLLDKKTAKRLHIHGAGAKGLPAGYPPSILLSGAVIVTTKAGTGTLRVIFPPAMAKRLAHARHLKVTLRITVRNAVRHVPRTTTLISTVVLKG